MLSAIKASYFVSKRRSDRGCVLYSELRAAVREALAGRRVSEVGDKVDRSLVASFDILNLVPEKSATDYDGTLGVNEPEGKLLLLSARFELISVQRGQMRADFLISKHDFPTCSLDRFGV